MWDLHSPQFLISVFPFLCSSGPSRKKGRKITSCLWNNTLTQKRNAYILNLLPQSQKFIKSNKKNKISIVHSDLTQRKISNFSLSIFSLRFSSTNHLSSYCMPLFSFRSIISSFLKAKSTTQLKAMVFYGFLASVILISKHLSCILISKYLQASFMHLDLPGSWSSHILISTQLQQFWFSCICKVHPISFLLN